MYIICLDIETTGLSPEHDKIIEIGAALVNLETRQVEDKFETFINPGVTIPNLVTNLTGITNEDVKDAPQIDEIKDELQNFIKDYPIMGHNISFDITFLEENGFNLPNTRLDSMDIAHIAIPKEKSYSLEIIAEKLGIEETGKHRALKDVIDNIEIIFLLLDMYFSKNNSEETRGILEKSLSPWKDILLYSLRNHQIPNTQTQQATTYNLQATTYNLQANTLQELPPHTTAEITPEKPEQKIIIATTEQENLTILNPNQYLNSDLFKELLKKDSLSAEETVFALKILPLQPTSYQLQATQITLPQNIKNLWFDYCHTNYPPETLKILQSSDPTILSHHTLGRLAKSEQIDLTETHLIIDNIEEFYGSVQQAFTASYFEERFANSKLPQETKEKLTILFGYIGIMYEKHGDKFALELNQYHYSTIEWQKIADLTGKIAADLGTEFEEEKLLKFLDKSKNGSLNLRIEIMLMQNGSPLLKITPLNIGELLAEKIWNKPDKLSLVGTSITYAQESPKGLYIKRLLNLPKNFAVEAESNNLEIETIDLPPPKDPAFTENADNYLSSNLEELEKPAFILVNSQRTASILHSKLALPLKDQGITVLTQGSSGGIGKIKLKSENKPSTTIIIGTYKFWQMLSPGPLETLIIYKIPFPPPGTTPFQEPDGFNSFTEYALPEARLKTKKIAKTAKKVISLDSRIN